MAAIPPPVVPLVVDKAIGEGHSYQRLGSSPRTATLNGAHAAGQTTITIGGPAASPQTTDIGVVEAGEWWEIRDATVNHAEYVQIAVCADVSVGATLPIMSPLIYPHADGTTVQDPTQLWGWRLSAMLGAREYLNRSIAGASLLIAGAPGSNSFGGNNAVSQRRPVGGQTLYSTTVPYCAYALWGVNDAADANVVAVGIPALAAAWTLQTRFWMAFGMLARCFDCYTPFPAGAINTVFANGAWATTAQRTNNQGRGIISVGTAGATATHTLKATEFVTGVPVVVTMCMTGQNVGNAALKASQWSFTLDGQPVNPIGYETTPFTTANVAPGIVGSSPIPVVARFNWTPTGVDSTLVATTGAGGGTMDWIGHEAVVPPPMAFGLSSTTPGATANTTACLAAFRTAAQAVRNEFPTKAPIALPDLWALMSPNGVPDTRYWTLAVDNTHPNGYGNDAIAWTYYNALNALRVNDYTRANV